MIEQELRIKRVSSSPPGQSEPQTERNKAYEERIRRFYETVSSRPLLTKRTHYMNMGYWKDGAQNLDEACEALTGFVGRFAQFGAGDRILDAGCGFGDQDIYWTVNYQPESITGINISRVQVESAETVVKELGLEDRISFHLGSATNLPFPDESFDRVVALEAAQHFGTREDFFREAYRVLRPGGQICLTDIIPLPGAVIRNFALNAMSLNRDNLYAQDIYAAKLRNAGFVCAAVVSLRDVVLLPFKEHMNRASRNASLAERLRNKVRTWLIPPSKLDYVIARGTKQ